MGIESPSEGRLVTYCDRRAIIHGGLEESGGAFLSGSGIAFIGRFRCGGRASCGRIDCGVATRTTAIPPHAGSPRSWPAYAARPLAAARFADPLLAAAVQPATGPTGERDSSSPGATRP